MSQGNVFFSSEADSWFERNRQALEQFDPREDLPLRLIELYGLKPRNVVELGASNGVRLAELNRRLSCRVVAVEPSTRAIEHGRAHYPAVQFHRALAHETGLTEQFDLLIMYYVFHWIDRSQLLSTVAEVDRLLADQGVLLIGDFHPDVPTRVPYHHLPGSSVFTYKQGYADLFLASELYTLLAFLSAQHPKTLCAEGPADSRGGVWLLRKDVRGRYVDRGYAGSPR